MLLNPRIGQLITIWYRKSNRDLPYHGQKGQVIITSKGKPRNHLVCTEKGIKIVVPCGNLQAIKE